MKRFVLGVAACAVIAAPAFTRAQQGTIIQQIIVKVNGEIFTLSELEQRQIQALREKNKVISKAADLQTDTALRAALADVTPDILVEAVDELLIVQRGRELGFRLTDERFKDVLDSVKKDNKLDDAGLKAALAQEGLSMEQYRQMMERQMIISSVTQQDILQKVNLTDEEARQYYQAHQNEFMKPTTVTLREISVLVPTETRAGQTTFSAGAAEAAQQKIAAARERLVKGEDFVKVAAEVSESPTKDKGGLLGSVNVGDLDPAMRDLLDKIKVGEVSEPIRTSRGYQLLKVDSRTEAAAEPFDTVRDKISRKVQEDRLDSEKKKYLTTLRASALIEWKHDEMKKMYEKRIAELAGNGDAPRN